MRNCLETLSYAALVPAFCLALALALAPAPAPAFGGSGKVYMASQYGDSVYVADLSVMDTWGKVKTSKGPDRLVASADGRYAFVSVPDEDRVVVIDVSADKVERSIEVDKRPRAMALTPDGKRLLVCSDIDPTVSVIDTESFRDAGRLTIGGSARDIKVSPDGREAYVAGGGRIEVIDIGKMAVSMGVDFPADASLMEISHTGGQLYVYGQEDKQIHVLAAASLKQTGTIKAGWGLKMSPDGKYLWFNGPGEILSVYSTADEKVVMTLPWESSVDSCYFEFSSDGKQVFAGPAGKEDKKVCVFDAASGKKTGELTAPPGLSSILYLGR